jgi:hypothetical protein
MITIVDKTGSCVDTQLSLQYSATVSYPPLSVSADSVVFNNLVSGTSYTTIAQDLAEGDNIIPIDHGELFTPAAVRLTGTPNTRVTVYFVLPTNLSPSDGIGAITMNYDIKNCNWVDENTDSARFFNPMNPFELFLDNSGKAILRIGGNPLVSSIITAHEFLGVGLITAEYTKFPTTKSTSGISVDNQAQVLFRAINTITGIKSNGLLPKYFVLHQNYPNPFNPSTTIRYELPKACFVALKVYHLLGQEVMTLVNERQNAGRYEKIMDCSSLSNGIYFYRLQSGDFVDTKKLIFIK